MICADPNLASQDAYLSSLYSRLMRLSIEKERATLRLEQKRWLEKERNKCADPACLEKAYDTRSTKLLEQWQAHVPPAVLAELSKRSGIPPDELKDMLSDCNGNQLQMNFCAFRSFVEADLDMQQVLASCGATLPARQKEWEASRDRQCNKEADDEAEGGSMRPMIFSACQATATEARTSLLRGVKSCSTIR